MNRIRVAFVAGAIVAFVGASLVGCKGTKRESVPETELAIGEKPTITTGPVGIGRKEREATYVLIDVENRGSKGAVVTMGGELTDLAEESLGPLRTETLRIPAGEKRMFALIDDKLESLATTAAGARVTLVRATRPEKEPAVTVTDFALYEDQERAVVKGMVVNTKAAAVKAMVIGAFYGPDGKPMMRRVTLYDLAGNGKRSAQFVGPKGSKTGTLFIGDVGL